MVKLTDQEVIRHYELRKQTLTEELSKVEAVLSALTARGTASKANNAKASKVKAGPVKKRKYTRRAQVAQSAPPSPAKAAPEGGWDSKIKAALNQIGSGDKEEIVQFLAGKEPGLAPEKIRKALTLRLAVLLKKNKLRGEQAGDQYRYSLA